MGRHLCLVDLATKLSIDLPYFFQNEQFQLNKIKIFALYDVTRDWLPASHTLPEKWSKQKLEAFLICWGSLAGWIVETHISVGKRAKEFIFFPNRKPSTIKVKGVPRQQDTPDNKFSLKGLKLFWQLFFSGEVQGFIRQKVISPLNYRDRYYGLNTAVKEMEPLRKWISRFQLGQLLHFMASHCTEVVS